MSPLTFYIPLDDDLREIRVLTLMPGGYDYPLHGVLSHVSLHSNPHYEPLSYVWGDPRDVIPMNISTTQDETAFSVNVTLNLAAALRTLRYPDKGRDLWVDALCINQNDNDEKSYQVRLMLEIYKTPSVLIWLGAVPWDFQPFPGYENMVISSTWKQQNPKRFHGKFPEPEVWSKSVRGRVGPPSDLIKEAFKFVEDIAGLEHLHDWPCFESPQPLDLIKEAFKFVEDIAGLEHLHDWPGFERSWSSRETQLKDRYQSILLALNWIMDLPYWNRVWTIQERLLPETGIVMYGPFTTQLRTLEKIARTAFNVTAMPDCCQKAKCDIRPAHWALIEAAFMPLKLLFEAGDLVKDEPVLCLENQLRAHRYAQATDPRDKIYAFLGLTGQPSLFEVDYRLDVGEVYRRFAVKCLEEKRNLKGLINSEGGSSPLGLPSWVPDWCRQDFDITRRLNHVERQCQYIDTFNASSGKEADFGILGPRSTLLRARGKFIDKIEVASDWTGPCELAEGTRILQTLTRWLAISGLEDVEEMLQADISSYVAGGSLVEAFWKTILCTAVSDRISGRTRPANESDGKVLLSWLRDAIAGRTLYKSPEISAVIDCLMLQVIGRGFFKTAKGLIGTGPCGLQQGDEIYVLFGTSAPYVLRMASGGTLDGLPSGSKALEYFGFCYVHGVMYGEAMDDPKYPVAVVYLT